MAATTWSGTDGQLYQEAIRVVPAMVKAKQRSDAEAMLHLYRGFHAEARRLEVRQDRAWAIFASAAIYWVTQLTTVHARHHDVEPSEAADQMVAAAVDWLVDAG